MPVAALLGAGDPKLVKLHQLGPKIKPEHIVMIGIRSFEEGEAAFLRAQGVRIFYMEEVHERGFDVIFREAIELIAPLTDFFGLTVDLDAFDPVDAPGVGSPEGYGLMKQEVLPALHFIGEHPKFCALEIAEYNPTLDQDDKTAQLIQHIILSTLQLS
jgi:arginase